jgi:hypothetical protein
LSLPVHGNPVLDMLTPVTSISEPSTQICDTQHRADVPATVQRSVQRANHLFSLVSQSWGFFDPAHDIVDEFPSGAQVPLPEIEVRLTDALL